MEPPSELIGIALSALFSALFTGTSAALVCLGRAHVACLLEDEVATVRGRRLMTTWYSTPGRVNGALRFGNFFANIVIAILSLSYVFEHVDGFSESGLFVIAVGLVIGLILLVGEILPRTIASMKPMFFLGAMSFLYPVYYCFSLLWRFVDLGSQTVVRLFGGEPQDDSAKMSQPDIELLIQQESLKGSLDEDKEALLFSVIGFSGTLVREVMVPRTDTVTFDLETTLDQILETIQNAGYSRYPVHDGNVDRIVGLVYAKDLLPWLRGPRRTPFVLKNCLREPFFVPETKPIDALMQEFQLNKMHMAIVVDEFGGTAGIVTQEDIIEEVFGEIYDEYDVEEEPEIQQQPDGSYLADARVNIRDLEEVLEVEFPEHTDYDTLAGFIVTHAGKVPEPGEEFGWEGVHFEVLESDSTKVTKVIVRKDLEPESENGEKEAAK